PCNAIAHHRVNLSENDDARQLRTNDSTCTQYNYNASAFPHGVRLSNGCDPVGGSNFQIVAAEYLFKVPAAARYNGIRLSSYGNTINAPEPVLSIIYNAATKEYDPVGIGDMEKNRTNERTTYRTVHGSACFNSGHARH